MREFKDYTVTIGKLGGATIRPGTDNITKVSLTVSPKNDPFNLSLQGLQTNQKDSSGANPPLTDTIKWMVADTLSNEWKISQVVIGKKLGNVNQSSTGSVFVTTEATGKAIVKPPNTIELRNILNPTEETRVTTDESAVGSDNRLIFAYRITFEKNTDSSQTWWIDPEIDVSPAHGG